MRSMAKCWRQLWMGAGSKGPVADDVNLIRAFKELRTWRLALISVELWCYQCFGGRQVNLITRLLRKVTFRLWSTSEILVLRRSAGAPPQSALSLPTGVEIRLVSHANLADALSFQNESQIESFRTLLNKGNRGYYAYLNGECVHRSWVQIGPATVSYLRVFKLEISDKDICVQYVRTAEKARGKGVYSSVLSRILADFWDWNAYILILPSNLPSLKGAYRAGFCKVAVVKVRYRLFVPFLTVESVCDGSKE